MTIKTHNFCVLVIYSPANYYMFFFSQNRKEFKIMKSFFYKNTYFIIVSCSMLKNKYLKIFDNVENLNILYVIYYNALYTSTHFLKYLTNTFLPLQVNNVLYLNFYFFVYKRYFFKFLFILQRILLLSQ